MTLNFTENDLLDESWSSTENCPNFDLQSFNKYLHTQNTLEKRYLHNKLSVSVDDKTTKKIPKLI